MMRFFIIWLAACGVMAAIISTLFWADRAIVALMMKRSLSRRGISPSSGGCATDIGSGIRPIFGGV